MNPSLGFDGSGGSLTVQTAQIQAGVLACMGFALYAVFTMSSDDRKLLIGNLSFFTTEETLEGVFSEYGKIASVVVARDRDTERSRGFGFVTFVSEEDAKVALQAMNGKQLDGRQIRVEHVGKSSDRSRGADSEESGRGRGRGDVGSGGYGGGKYCGGGYGSRESYGSGQSGGYE